MRDKIVIANTILILIILNFLIFSKESVLRNGQEVYLELAPVDPRSLLQGDYMALSYRLSLEIFALSPAVESQDGYVIASFGPDRVARSPRLAKSDNAPGPNELKLFYRKRGRDVKIATDAYFFEEGQSNTFSQARYGILRIDNSGHSVLTGMADEKFNKIENAVIK